MSLILDALKKLEQEKAARQRKGDLRPAVIRGRGVTPAITRVVLLAVAVSVVGTAGAIWGVMKLSSPVSSATPAVTTAAPLLPQQASSPPVASPLPPPQPLQPAPEKIDAPRPADPPVVAQQSLPRAVTAPPPEDLKVTGIAWQDEREARRAVVNGSLAGEGAVIGAARIAEIFPDRVRFTVNGRRSDVFITTPFAGSSR